MNRVTLRLNGPVVFLVVIMLLLDVSGSAACVGRTLRFLANVDPVDVARALEGLDPETTMVRGISECRLSQLQYPLCPHSPSPGQAPLLKTTLLPCNVSSLFRIRRL